MGWKGKESFRALTYSWSRFCVLDTIATTKSAQAGTELVVVDEDFSTMDSEDNDTNIYANGTAASPKLGP